MSETSDKPAADDPWRELPHEVILCNFGGPTCRDEVEPFLRRLFKDPLIIRAPIGAKLRGWLARRIAKKRAPSSAEEYERIGYSPLIRVTNEQARHLEHYLREKRPQTKVYVVNRYTPPFASEVVPKLDLEGARQFVVPLYPHLCHSTTVSSFRDLDLAFERYYGSLPFVSTRVYSWWQHPSFLAYQFKKIQETLATALPSIDDGAPVTVMFSAHGIPKRYKDRGDPYVGDVSAQFEEMRARGRQWLVEFAGGRHKERLHWQLSFQSRVGPVEWTRPYTDELIQELGTQRGGHLILVPISFTSDHIETLFEMDVTYRELAQSSGFQSYDRVSAANDDPEFSRCLRDVLLSHGF